MDAIRGWRTRIGSPLLASLLLLAGCGGDDDEATIGRDGVNTTRTVPAEREEREPRALVTPETKLLNAALTAQRALLRAQVAARLRLPPNAERVSTFTRQHIHALESAIYELGGRPEARTAAGRARGEAPAGRGRKALERADEAATRSAIDLLVISANLENPSLRALVGDIAAADVQQLIVFRLARGDRSLGARAMPPASTVAVTPGEGVAEVLQGGLRLQAAIRMAYQRVGALARTPRLRNLAARLEERAVQIGDGLTTALRARAAEAPPAPRPRDVDGLRAARTVDKALQIAMRLEELAAAGFRDALLKPLDPLLAPTVARALADSAGHLVVLRLAAGEPPLHGAFARGAG